MTIDPEIFLNLFAGAPDQVLLESQSDPVTLVAPTDLHAHAEAHFGGQDRLGVFSMGDDSTVRWATLPFDRHCLPNAWTAAQTVHAALQGYGIPSYLEALEPTPDPEYRLWLFFDTPRNAKRVAYLLRGLVVDCELDDTLPIVPGGAEALADTPQRVWLPLYGGDSAAGFVDANGQLYPDQGQRADAYPNGSEQHLEALQHDLLLFLPEAQDSRANHQGNEHGFRAGHQAMPVRGMVPGACRPRAAEDPVHRLGHQPDPFWGAGHEVAVGDRPTESGSAC